MSEPSHVDALHVPRVEAARALARNDARLRALLSDELDARGQLGALIEFCAIGVRLLRPVESWLRRAAVGCDEAGFDSLGGDFDRLQRDAASRRLRLIDDFVQLATLWTERGGPALDLGALVRRPLPASAGREAALREAAAAEPLPFGMLGVELELGEFATWFGPQLLRASERKLGSVVLERLTYLQTRTEHAALRTDDLLERLDELLRAVPELAGPIADAGAQVLVAHVEVWGACVERGARLGLTSASVVSVATL